MHKCIKFILFWSNTPHVSDGVSRPSSGVQDCKYSNQTDNGCLLASGYPLANRQQYLFDIYLLLYVQSVTLDVGRKDRTEHVECYSKIKQI